MRPESCHPINCRSSQPLSVSCEEPHPPPTSAVNSADADAQHVPLPGASCRPVRAGWRGQALPASPPMSSGNFYFRPTRGATWSTTGTGLTNAGRATLAVATPGDTVVFAFAANPDGFSQRDLFWSDDGGLHWIALNITGKKPISANFFQPNMNLMGVQAYYNQLILVDPGDSTRRTIYLGGKLATAKTVDGDATWTLITSWFPIPGSPFDDVP